MKVSIITLTYNSEKYIEYCVKSVINQDYACIEYIVIDGKSIDKTLNILNKYSNNIDILISEKDNGLYDALNKGIRLATGDIIGILHSDDFFHDSNVISRIVKSFNNNLDVVFSDSFFINDAFKFKRYYSSRYFSNWMFKFGLMPSHPTIYIKKEIFLSNNLYNSTFSIAADFEFILRLFIIKKIRYKYIKDIWVVMREGGVSTKNLYAKFKITKELMIACKLNNLSTNYILLSLRFLFKITQTICRIYLPQRVYLKDIQTK